MEYMVHSIEIAKKIYTYIHTNIYVSEDAMVHEIQNTDCGQLHIVDWSSVADP